ncbi:MAG: FtsX-like permease family protein [Clostridia bacterium]|nr:FtsX-like permease family protein [Clostridia bacterium]
MNKALVKDTLRTIDRTKSRFISLVSIVALGISFFAGVHATAPDMLDTARKYYLDTNVMDLQIISTAGLTDDDVRVIAGIQGVEQVSGEKFVDGVLRVNGEKVSELDGSELTVRAYGLDIEKAANAEAGVDDRTFLNRPQLLEGNWPTQANQCLVDASNLSTPKEFQIGAIVSIDGAGTDIDGTLHNREFAITGIIRTPLYINFERGNTQIGTGKLGTFIYIPQENFKTDYYSSLSIKLQGTDTLDPYSDEYEAYIAPYVQYISSISQDCLAPRVTRLRAQYTSEVEKGDRDYAAAKQQTDTKIQEAEKQVATVLDMAENGDAKLAEFKRQYNEKAAEANQKIGQSKLEHSTQYAAYEQKRAEYNAAKAQVDRYANAETELKTAQTEYNVANTQVTTLMTTVNYLENLIGTTRGAISNLDSTQRTQVSDIINRFEQSGLVGVEVDNIISSINSLTAVGTAEEMAAYLEPQLQTLELQLANTRRELTDTKAVLAAKKVELDNAKVMVEQLKGTREQLAAAEEQLNAAEKQLTGANYDIQFGELEVLSQLTDAKNQITNYETNLQIAKSKAPTIKEEFEQQKAEAYSKLQSAKDKLDAAKSFLLGLDTAKWYVNDRNEALKGFMEYGETADRTAAIAIIFPWFFFLVSTLVSLNTMTRMVEDERTQLGTLKALGFYNKEIIFKYIFYALTASVIGGVAGSLLGFILFPLAITTAFNIMFDVPALVLKYRFTYAIPGLVISILSTVMAANGASYRSLNSVASALMRPKAPKGGKRVLLERFPKLWASLSFTWKVTWRNVFRNKKRFIMAVIGVFGCTALLVAGFGLDKSIKDTLKGQFTAEDSIIRYDMQIVTNGSYDITVMDCDALNYVRSRPEIGNANLTYMKVFDTTNSEGKTKMETYLVVPEDASMLEQYIYLRDAETGEHLEVPEHGCVITKKMAVKLKLDVGDTILINIDDETQIPVPVAAICENYIFHYLYLSKDVYARVFNANPQYNYITARLAYDLTTEQKDNLAKDLMAEYSINALAYQEDIQSSFDTLFDALGYIVVVMVVSAGLLSLIVLYNLSSINIHERIKEIATIKVLGFNDKEVATYIFRENILLGVFGTIFGLLGGIGLHRIVILVGEVDLIRFGRDAGIMAFVWATVLSMGFTMLVNLILMRNLRKVDMVESLKSIE